jgi:hypothetical protein
LTVLKEDKTMLIITRHRQILLLTALATFCAVTGCTKVAKDTGDTTRPNVEFKVRGDDGQYAPASDASMATTGSLNFMCIVSDPQGVSSIALDFAGSGENCSVDGAQLTALNTNPFPKLPKPEHQNLKADPSGNVLASLPLLDEIRGPLTCQTNEAKPRTGVPSGDQIIVTCTGQNWSSDDQKKTATKKLTITLN